MRHLLGGGEPLVSRTLERHVGDARRDDVLLAPLRRANRHAVLEFVTPIAQRAVEKRDAERGARDTIFFRPRAPAAARAIKKQKLTFVFLVVDELLLPLRVHRDDGVGVGVQGHDDAPLVRVLLEGVDVCHVVEERLVLLADVLVRVVAGEVV